MDTIPTVEQRIMELIGAYLKIDTSPFNASSKLEDMGADDLDKVEILMGIEDSFDVSLDIDPTPDMDVQFLIDAVEVAQAA